MIIFTFNSRYLRKTCNGRLPKHIMMRQTSLGGIWFKYFYKRLWLLKLDHFWMHCMQQGKWNHHRKDGRSRRASTESWIEREEEPMLWGDDGHPSCYQLPDRFLSWCRWQQKVRLQNGFHQLDFIDWHSPYDSRALAGIDCIPFCYRGKLLVPFLTV